MSYMVYGESLFPPKIIGGCYEGLSQICHILNSTMSTENKYSNLSMVSNFLIFSLVGGIVKILRKS